MDADSPRLRLSILGIVVFALFATLFVRLYYLQVMRPESGEVMAAANRVRVIQEEAPRGRLLDATGRVLVDNRTSLVVTVEKQELNKLDDDERSRVVLSLATELTASGIPTKVAGIERRLEDPQYSPIQPVPVAIDVSEDLMVYLAERSDEFPAVDVHRESVRSYPHGSLAAHVVGYVGRISQDELTAKMGTRDEPKTIAKPYQPDSDVGRTGIERTFEDDLRGTPGIKTVEIDSEGEVVRQIGYQEPIPGNDVQLTIDIGTQEVAEAKLVAQLDEARAAGFTRDGKRARAPAGASVVLDPRNGNVVAMASYPTYDPSEFVNGINTDRYQQLIGGDAVENPLINRAIGGLYAPGSTFKTVTAYAAVKAGMIDPGTYIGDGGFIMVGQQRYQNAGSTPHGSVNLSSAMTVSSDVYFYLLGQQFWNDRDTYGDGIQNAARDFGFGAPTGIQLPGELAGLIPDPAWKRQLYESMSPEEQANGDPAWYTGNSVNLSIGQGDMLATPLQMANSYAALVDGGTVRRPNLVLRVLKPGSVEPGVDPATLGVDTCNPADAACPLVRTVDNGILQQIDIPANVLRPLEEGLLGVTEHPRGTGYRLFEGFDSDGWPVMGKTGTAEAANNLADSSLFVGVGPADDPQYVALAVLEESGFGADAAGPVVKTIFKHVSGQTDDCAPEDTASGSTPDATILTNPDGSSVIDTNDCDLDGAAGADPNATPDPSAAGDGAAGTGPTGTTGTAGTGATGTGTTGTGGSNPSVTTPTTFATTPTTNFTTPTTAGRPTSAFDPTATTNGGTSDTTGTGGADSTDVTDGSGGTGTLSPEGIVAGPVIPVVGLGALGIDRRRRRRRQGGPRVTIAPDFDASSGRSERTDAARTPGTSRRSSPPTRVPGR